MSLWISSIHRTCVVSLRRQCLSSCYLFDTQFELAFARRTMATSIRQPEWHQPVQSATADLPPLKIYNSLTRTKTPFVPIDRKEVKWYACGPTVYDDSHLGHARNYVSTDILRRIMRDYFKFNVQYIQNVTDVDDKIILRGRQKYLLDELKQGRLAEYSQNISDTRISALRAYLAKNLPKIPEDTPPATVTKDRLPKDYASLIDESSRQDGEVLSDKDAKTQMHIKTVLGASRALITLESEKEAQQEDLNHLDDVMMPFLDEGLKSTIDASDHAIFTKLTKLYEKRYTEDMRALNVLDPDEITRVTEYGPQIVDFVKQIEQNQFAYSVRDKESPNASVYFDIKAFEAANNSYARLEPWNRNDTDLLADGEGALSKDATGKRSPADFALWKASKPGEPSWPSPWGAGRPGWHIECSAMASDRLGKQFDIHSGGIDLAFPHHDNEIAQSEAYWNRGREHQQQWVNYFLHMGHLSIRGAKMSKSLKNFTTIREALERGTWTPRGLRIVFLLGGWKDGIEITDDVVKEGSAWEDRVNNFFIKAKDVLGTATDQKSSPAGQILLDKLERAKNETLDALCNSFDTPIVMRIISDLISDYNIAYNNRDPPPTPHTTRNIAEWVTSIVNTFGLNGTITADDPSIGWSGIDVPEDAKPILTKLSQKRDGLRRRAKSKTEGISNQDLAPVPYPERPLTEAQSQLEAPFREVLERFNKSLKELNNSHSLAKDILQLSDRLRDVDLWERDVYLEDRDGDLPALIRPVTKELRASRQAKEKAVQEKQREKEQREQNKKNEETSKVDKGKQDHMTMFRTEVYSGWDADGIPTKDKDGEEITKSRRKKLTKDWERQKKLHEAYLAKAD